MKIAVLGTRGIPAKYSGFETCVQETSFRFIKRDHFVRVYCRKGRVGDLENFPSGIDLTTVPCVPGKTLETVTHTFFSVLHLSVHRVDVVQVYGAGNGWCIPIIRMMGIRVIFLVDGVDWERAKWGEFAKAFLRWSARIGSRTASSTVADSKHVISVMETTLRAAKIEFVPYGARIVATSTTGKLRELGLQPNDYFLFVGRFVPEKNVHLLVRAFEIAKVKKHLVLVGGNSYDKRYEQSIRQTTCDRIVYPGFVFGLEYEELLNGCYAYIQPSVLEGTSPSLLAAMGAGACVLVSDIPENRETVESAGFYFKSNDLQDLARMIETVDRFPEDVAKKRSQSLERVMKYYSWDVVSDQLLRLSM